MSQNPMAGADESAQPHRAHEILEDPEFILLARRKNIVTLSLTAITFVVYFGYMALLAFKHPLAARGTGTSATLGIPLGIGVIILGWILTGVYVAWANRSYDAMVDRVKQRIR